ncbi:hypothetical protein HJC23_007664, partial [Cyclotella cryptica]
DVFQGHRLTSEANRHTYGLWRMILCELNMEQLIRIVQKATIKNNAMFESNFDALQSNMMKVYPSGLQESIKNMQKDHPAVALLRRFDKSCPEVFSPPLPDPRAVAVSAASSISNNNNDLMYKSECDNDEPLVSFNMETPDTSQSQLETHIAGLKTAAELDSDADVDIDIGSDRDIHYNTTIIVDGETEDNTTNGSDAFIQFKTLLQNSNNLVDVLSNLTS